MLGGSTLKLSGTLNIKRWGEVNAEKAKRRTHKDSSPDAPLLEGVFLHYSVWK